MSVKQWVRGIVRVVVRGVVKGVDWGYYYMRVLNYVLVEWSGE